MHKDKWEGVIQSRMGAQAVKELLTAEDIGLVADLKERLTKTRSKQMREKLAKRLKIVGICK